MNRKGFAMSLFFNVYIKSSFRKKRRKVWMA